MKLRIRVLIVAAALLTSVVAAPAVASATPESASGTTLAAQDPVPSDDAGDRVFTAPAAPRSIDPPANKAGAAAASPTISPSDSSPYTDYTFVPPNSDYTCPSGNFCTGVWDPTRSLWKLFYLYYTLYNWIGNGFAVNNQSGGVYARLYNSSGALLRSIPADGVQRSVDWDPVYYIRNC